MKALVTGGAGFIGSHVVDALIAGGHEVVVIDDLSSGKKENISSRAVFFEKSITSDLGNLFSEYKFDTVFHLAAIASVQYSIKEPAHTHDTHVQGTLNLLEYCRKHNVKRFVFSSSSAVYGDQKEFPLHEGMTPNPMSPYALHKLIGEYYCKLYHFLYGLETISLIYSNVYGARQNPSGDYAGLIPKFLSLMREGKTPTIFGDGEQTRDFIHVSDVVAANLAAALTNDKKCFGEFFNIGSGNQISVNDVLKAIKEIIGSSIEPIYGGAVIEPKHTRADITKARDLLGWQPKTPFEEGLRTLIQD